jgi:hypothetical protein
MLDQGDLVMIGFEISPLLLLSVNVDRRIDIDVVDILLCVKLLYLDAGTFGFLTRISDTFASYKAAVSPFPLS